MTLCAQDTSPVRTAQRQRRGRRADLSGRAAEDRVARLCRDRGMAVLHRRWRGVAGEIDLIARQGAELVFVEVKSAASFDRAAETLGQAQIRRLCAAAEEFVTGQPDGALTPMRFDVALVDGRGAARFIENAIGHF